MHNFTRSAGAGARHDIDVEHVFLSHDAEDMLVDVDLRIGEGVTCLIGRGAADRSAFLRVLAGVVAPDRGSVRIGGEPARGRPGARALVSYLPRRPALHPALTVADNLRFWGAALGLQPAAIALRTLALARWFDLGPLLAKRAADLGRGQQQAVALVRTFLRDGPVLLLDEPGAGLECAAADALHDYLRRRAAAGAVVVVSTGELESASRLGEHFLLLTPHRSIEALARSRLERGDGMQ